MKVREKIMKEIQKANAKGSLKILVSEYMSGVYEQKPLEELLELANMFHILADLEKSKDDIKSYNDAAIRYKYVLKIVEDAELPAKTIPELKQKLDGLKESSWKALAEMQTLIVKKCGVDLPLSEKITDLESIDKISHKKLLEDLRDHSKAHITTDVVGTKALFGEIADRMKMYLKTLYEEAESVLGEPPCKYTVIGLGSMALGQTTPYSDLEFAILTENDEYTKDETTKNYFKNLTHYVHFKVICLGETIIPTSDYGVDMSTIVPPAVNFDLGGKTPLGRIEKDKDYDLVQTIDGMLNQNLRSEGIDKNLHTVVEASCFIYGKTSLLDKYREGVKTFLSNSANGTQLNSEAISVKRLFKGEFEVDNDGKRKDFLSNLEEFRFDPQAKEGALFNVKQEIYRVPDRMIYNLGLIYGVQKDNPWDTIDELFAKSLITKDGSGNLKEALSFALNLRLRAYSHYGFQEDEMDIDSKFCVGDNVRLKNIFRLSEDELSETGALFKFYYTALPFMRRIKAFCEGSAELSAEQKRSFFIRVDSLDNDFYIAILDTKIVISMRLNFADERITEMLHKQLSIMKEIGKKDVDKDIAFIHNMLAKYHSDKASQKFRDCVETALSILEKLPVDSPHTLVASCYNNLGVHYFAKEEYKEALKHHMKAHDIYERIPQDVTFRETTSVMNNIILDYIKLKRPKEAIEWMEKAEMLLKDKPHHKDTVQILFNIGELYSELNEHKKAFIYKLKSMQMEREILQGKGDLDIAKKLWGALSDYVKKDESKGDIDNFKKLVELQEQIYYSQPNEYCATSVLFLSSLYRDNGNLDMARKTAMKALKMGINSGLDTSATKGVLDSIETIQSLQLRRLDKIHQTASLLSQNGSSNEALKHKIEELKLADQIFGEISRQVADIYLEIADMWSSMGKRALYVKNEAISKDIKQKLAEEEALVEVASDNAAIVLEETRSLMGLDSFET